MRLLRSGGHQPPVDVPLSVAAFRTAVAVAMVDQVLAGRTVTDLRDGLLDLRLWLTRGDR